MKWIGLGLETHNQTSRNLKFFEFQWREQAKSTISFIFSFTIQRFIPLLILIWHQGVIKLDLSQPYHFVVPSYDTHLKYISEEINHTSFMFMVMCCGLYWQIWVFMQYVAKRILPRIEKKRVEIRNSYCSNKSEVSTDQSNQTNNCIVISFVNLIRFLFLW